MQYKIMDELGDVRKRRGVTYYHQLYTLLSSALNDGSIAAGRALPSETEMMERFQVSRTTVRRALGQLEQEKRIIRRRGSGSYARRVPQSEHAPDSIVEVLRDFDPAKSPTTSRLVRVQGSETPEFIRRRDPAFGDKSLLVQRCRSYKNEPFMFSTSYVPEIIGARLTRRLLTKQVVLSALDGIGVTPSTAEQTTTAALADAITARHLDVEPASALLCVIRLIKDESGRSIEYQSHSFRPDRWHLHERVVIERSPSGLRWSDSKKTARLPAAL
jgi:GntR family transcriptional regulator